MDVAGWCGRCGQRFALAETLAPPYVARCPRCGETFAADYSPVVAAAVRQLVAALAALDGAGRQLGAVAPRLHVDADRLAAELRALFDH